jgi:gluconokinase
MSSQKTVSVQQKAPTRWVIMGVSGCGKSEVGTRLATRLGITLFEGDSVHSPENVAKMAAGSPLTDMDRQGWLALLRDRIREAREAGDSLVLSCSALKRSYRDLLRQGDPDLVFVHLHGNRDVIANRMQARPGHFMPVSLLESQLRDLEPPGADERAIRIDIETPLDAIADRILDNFDSLPEKRS